MMSGKALSRATRGHFLVDSALHALLMSKICPAAIPESVNSGSAADKEKEADEVIPDDEIVDETDYSNMLVYSSPVLDIDRLTHLTMMYEQLEEKKINRKDICSNDSLKEVDQKINELREKAEKSQNSCLMVPIHGHDFNITAVHSSRKNRRLGWSSQISTKDATILCSFRASSLPKVSLQLLAKHDETRKRASRCLPAVPTWKSHCASH